MSDLRKKFTENAEQFDSLMVEMLAENAELKALLEHGDESIKAYVDSIKHFDEINALLAKESADLKAQIEQKDSAFRVLHRTAMKIDARNALLEKVVDAAKKNMSFDAGQYIYNKECGNLVDRNPDTLALLESLYNLNQQRGDDNEE